MGSVLEDRLTSRSKKLRSQLLDRRAPGTVAHVPRLVRTRERHVEHHDKFVWLVIQVWIGGAQCDHDRTPGKAEANCPQRLRAVLTRDLPGGCDRGDSVPDIFAPSF